GVGAREIGYLFGQYKRIVDRFDGGVLTGKGLTYGGSLARTQATGYGLCYFSAEALKHLKNDSYEGKTVVVSGSGNVAQYCAQKVTQLGGKVVAMSDSQGYVYDPKGIDLPKLFDIKQKRRARISVYAQEVEGAEYVEGCKNIWNVKCDIAHPCASQNEMDEKGAQALVDNGCMAVFEGANMPLTPEAIAVVQKNGLLYSPGKASNAGGVATSGLEMSQNSIRMSWSFEEVDEKLQGIMKNIYKACYDASVECGRPGDLMVGANVAGFLKVAEAMMAQGVV
ncbi:MAG: NADP-specific glutamate dehydrogenase, partial [Oscillospiraceae bacterium]|nr:NADP-specific glutamate dehydrogenase [Oscillospiraceae bacterium]